MRRAVSSCCTSTIIDGRQGAVLGAAVALVLLATLPAAAQPSYSIDGQSPLSLGSGGGLFSEGDVLGPGPVLLAAGGGLGIAPTLTGPLPGTYAEMDGMSYGVDAATPFVPFGLLDFDPVDMHSMVHRWYFSVDEFAGGDPGSPIPLGGPSVVFEGAFGAMEASADVFMAPLPASFGPLAGPVPPPPFTGVPGANIQVFDGDGTTAPPLGLVEPNPPTPFVPPLPGFSATPDPGDNVDAIDVDTFAPAPLIPGTPVFFSMDTGAFPDPIENPAFSPTPAGFAGPNFGTAFTNGFSGADIVSAPAGAGGPIALFAPAAAMGLDTFGVDTDDIDALIVTDFGPIVGAYDPVTGPYSWVGGATDMVLFSLRRGSATIGTPDSLTGTPIEEGDILIPGIAGGAPGIFVAAEDLGLGTLRSGTATFVDAMGVLWADDLDALDVEQHKRGDVDGDFDVDADDIDLMAAIASAPVSPFIGAPVVADMDFDLFVDTTFNPLIAGLGSDTDWLIRDVLGTEYGDANLDGKVDVIDFDLLGQGLQGLGAGWLFGDFDGSGVINAGDLLILATYYGFVAPGAGAGPQGPTIPEPSTGSLACLALALVCFGTRLAQARRRFAWRAVCAVAALLAALAIVPSALAVDLFSVDDPMSLATATISVERSPEPDFLTYTLTVKPLMPLTEITTIEAAFTSTTMRQVNPFGAATIFTDNNGLFLGVGEDPQADSQFEFHSGSVLTLQSGESGTSLSATFTNFVPITAATPIAHVVLPDGIKGTMDMTLVVRDTGIPGEGDPAVFSSVTFQTLPGDYNDDGKVNAADYTEWRNNKGQPAGTLPNDIDGGVISQAQYNTWRDNYGDMAAPSPYPSPPAAAPVPEPATWVGCLWWLIVAAGWRRKK